MTKRSPWLVVIFGIITLGIYQAVWLYKTRLEMVAKGRKIPSFWWLFAPLLGLVAAAFLEFIIRFGLSRTGSDGSMAGSTLQSTSNMLSILLGVVAIIALFPLSFYWFYKYCKAVESVTGGQTEFGLAYALWIVFMIFNLSFIWPGIIQNGFNKVP